MASTKTNSEPTLTSRSVKMYYQFKIGPSDYEVIESFDGNNELCFREIKRSDWGGSYSVTNESLRKKLIKAVKQYRVFN
jgi:hypothetical protein